METVDARDWLDKLVALTHQEKPGVEDVEKVFEPGGFWRDLAAVTWNLHTAEGSEAIAAMIAGTDAALDNPEIT